jgi:ABC-type antimicrobial peptide transport system permease subunit
MFMAGVGLYAVLAFVVEQRTRDLGIRMALGAERGRVIGMVIQEMLRVVLAGVLAGVVASLLCGRYVEPQLAGVHHADPAIIVMSAAITLLVSISAAFIPAWRASLIDPIAALRCE